MRPSDATEDAEGRLEAVLLRRILQGQSADVEAAKSVAEAEAHRLYCLALLVIEHLHDARTILEHGLLEGADPELLSIVFDVKDALGESIASELLVWKHPVNQVFNCRASSQDGQDRQDRPPW